MMKNSNNNNLINKIRKNDLTEFQFQNENREYRLAVNIIVENNDIDILTMNIDIVNDIIQYFLNKQMEVNVLCRRLAVTKNIDDEILQNSKKKNSLTFLGKVKYNVSINIVDYDIAMDIKVSDSQMMLELMQYLMNKGFSIKTKMQMKKEKICDNEVKELHSNNDSNKLMEELRNNQICSDNVKVLRKQPNSNKLAEELRELQNLMCLPDSVNSFNNVRQYCVICGNLEHVKQQNNHDINKCLMKRVNQFVSVLSMSHEQQQQLIDKLRDKQKRINIILEKK